MTDSSSVTALLGPTNTGKTHRAIERMLAYDSGMIGLPLRLLAREVYDRITPRVGEARVALVTGEEKRIPPRPDYWICTVEAMPTLREVDFVAVDEVQLAAHAQRGHVFTDRILHARGRRETWLLGAGTMRGVLAELAPTAKHAEHPRLSRLSFAGDVPLARVPPRSAVVAFSMPQVYEIAERLRALRGGAAVVLGALSPRTRNAQVAMFQAGEVDHLVATDAIGMGLNLDVRHVAFAATRKFDGREARDLDEAELAQIAGRAGRYVQDGTFGTLSPVSLPLGVAAAIEQHRFAPVRQVEWRSVDLDFASVDALAASLRAPPRLRCARLARGAEDAAALEMLSARDAVRARARGTEAVSLLWDVCTVPDFRRLLFEVHVAFLEELFLELLASGGHLSDDWIAPRVAELDDETGDVDTLVARIAQVRTWTYVAYQARWVARAREWQERTRAIEDRLSDALHDRLVMRFVDRAGKKRGGRSPSRGHGHVRPRASEPPEVDPRHPFASLRALREKIAPHAPAPAASSGDRWVEAIVDAPHERFTLDASGHILEGERVLARLAPGTGILLPDVHLVGMNALGAGARSRLLRRLTAVARDVVHALLAPLRAIPRDGLSDAARGLLYRVEQGLGTALADEAMEALDENDRATLAAHGVHVGRLSAYARELLRPEAIAARAPIASVHWLGPRRALSPPPGGRVSAPLEGRVEPRAYVAIGYLPLGPRAVRADVAEKVAAAIGGEDEARIPSRLGCSARDAARVVVAIRAR